MPNTRAYWLHALSPTHLGTGRGVGYIDLPIDRDAVTNWPIVRGSAFKGVWADSHTANDTGRKNDPELRAAFGVAADEGQNNSNSGSLMPTDARLVCLPARSFRGTFAWCTSALALRLVARTLGLSGFADLPAAPGVPKDADGNAPGQALVTKNTLLTEGGSVYLEDLDFVAVESREADAWAAWLAKQVFDGDDGWQAEFGKRFVVLPDAGFDFLAETGTEVHTRVKIDDDTKTVADGALWTEEAVPAETIFAGVVACDRVFGRGVDFTADKLLNRFAGAGQRLTLQIGGKATVGRGQVRCVFTDPKGGAK